MITLHFYKIDLDLFVSESQYNYYIQIKYTVATNLCVMQLWRLVAGIKIL